MLVNFINLINFCLVDSTHYSDLRGKLKSSSSCLNEGCYLLIYRISSSTVQMMRATNRSVLD